MHHARLCRIVDDKVRFEVLKLLRRRTDEHIRDKMCLPRHLHDKANGHARIFICAAECVDDKKALVAELADRNLAYSIPRFLRSAVIVVRILLGGPPNRIMRGLIIDNVLILRRTARIDARHDIDRILHLRHLPALIALEVRAELLAKQLVIVRVVDNLCRARDTVLCQINRCHDIYLFLFKRLAAVDARHALLPSYHTLYV